MGFYFGTDGIRGIVNSDLSYEIMYKCGNALAQIKDKPTIVIGRDTRVSGTFVTSALSFGAMLGGANVIDVGIITTPGISYLTKLFNFDFGIVISASHNEPKYNGIKIFDNNGIKISEEVENKIETCFGKLLIRDSMNVGKCFYKTSYTKYYINSLLKIGENYNGLKIALDLSNGASFNIAPKIFKKLGAKVVTISNKNCGEKINVDCGALHPENLRKVVVNNKCDIGFAFDGDADRICVILKNGKIIDGDEILYLLLKYYKLENEKINAVVGTSLTNSGIEKEINKLNVRLIRSDVGDKFVVNEMIKNDCILGGEQSGHIINMKYSNSGDGILTAILILNVLTKYGDIDKFLDAKPLPQISLNVAVDDKIRVINNEKLKEYVLSEEEKMGEGRILLRASGTEPKIRIMVESKNYEIARMTARRIERMVNVIK